MRPTVRSRLVAAVVAFGLGFVAANVGVLVIAGADRWLWLGVAAVLMLTGAVGILVSDTRRPLSLWAALGVELILALTLLPLLWLFTVATAASDVVPQGLVPTSISWEAFGTAVGPGDLRTATLTSLLVGAVATLLSVVLAVPAAYALARRAVPGRRVLYLAFVVVLVAPLVAVLTGSALQADDLGLTGQWWTLVPATLLLGLPLALWLSVTVMRSAPWNLRDAVRADGATRLQELRGFVVPVLGPSLLLVTLLVLVVTTTDALVGAALAPGPEARTLPATLLLAADTLETGPSTVAATGLVWLLPVLALLAIAPRRIAHLIGRTYR